jgi:hypothetical protein
MLGSENGLCWVYPPGIGFVWYMAFKVYTVAPVNNEPANY